MEFKRATMDDFPIIADFYKYVIENTEEIFEQANWEYGMHPTDESLKAYISEGAVYYLLDDGVVVSVMCLPLYQTSDYEPISWKYDVSANEIASLHLFAVRPDCNRRGIGTFMVDKCLDVARENGKKTVRLDTLAVNTRAQAFYDKYGFIRCGTQVRTLENDLDFDFIYYEYLV